METLPGKDNDIVWEAETEWGIRGILIEVIEDIEVLSYDELVVVMDALARSLIESGGES